ncbi:MAG: hypothetical protein HUK19_00895 [Fibrobacter sp.]|nr:hypothetical protein [Fibrobacter sp.]
MESPADDDKGKSIEEDAGDSTEDEDRESPADDDCNSAADDESGTVADEDRDSDAELSGSLSAELDEFSEGEVSPSDAETLSEPQPTKGTAITTSRKKILHDKVLITLLCRPMTETRPYHPCRVPG